MIISIIRSVLITSIIACSVGFALSSIIGFWQGFTAAVIIQFALYNIATTFNINRSRAKTLELEIENILNRSEAEVECPCGKNRQLTYIFIGEEPPILVCPECSNKFRVVTTLSTQLLTEPINLDNLFNKLRESKELINKVN